MEQIDFDPKIAEEYGLQEAVILALIQKEVAAARMVNINLYGGRYWVRKSWMDLYAQLPFIRKYRIKEALQKLVEAGLLVEGYYNEDPFDRTKWYSI